MKTKQFTRLLLVCCMSCFVTNTCRADQAEDEAAIRQSDEAYVTAYNKQDAKALAAMWSPEAVYVDPETGKKAVGRAEIEKEFAETFTAAKDAKLEIDVKAIKFLSPNVAVESGTARTIRWARSGARRGRWRRPRRACPAAAARARPGTSRRSRSARSSGRGRAA